jgi:hypothetical protein
MSSAPSPEDIARDARWLVQALDPAAGVVRLIAMDREAYRGASFLDDRMLQPPVDAHLVPWAKVAGALPADARRDARWIFHIGHVGSTLLARLLGELPGVLSVREPRFLRDVTTVEAGQRAPFTRAAQALFSRTFAADEVALVKATSFVSEIAPELVPAGGKALFMHARPQAYVASILAGENSLKELDVLAPNRAARMAVRVIGLAAPESAADLAAAAWACEITSLEAAAEAMPDRAIAWMDFDQALRAMSGELGRAAALFGFKTAPGTLDALADGPLMRRYSKALEFEYSPGLRRDLIADATRRHKADIDGALAKLRRAAETSPLLARALERAQPET